MIERAREPTANPSDRLLARTSWDNVVAVIFRDDVRRTENAVLPANSIGHGVENWAKNDRGHSVRSARSPLFVHHRRRDNLNIRTVGSYYPPTPERTQTVAYGVAE